MSWIVILIALFKIGIVIEGVVLMLGSASYPHSNLLFVTGTLAWVIGFCAPEE